MKRIALLTAILATGMAQAKDEPKLKFAATEVGEGLYMLAGEGGFTGGNLGLSVGADGVVLIDDAMPNTLGIMNDAIKAITDQPIDFLINTHAHGDHIGNNEAMAKTGAHIVAHENLREFLVKKGVYTPDGFIPASKETLPVLTFAEEMTIHLNGQPAKAIHVPKAHTDGDSIVHFPKANVIHAGDVFFNGLFPFIDLDSGGSVDGYIDAQIKIISMSDNDTKIIPGHGPVASKADLQKAVEMLIDAKKIIHKHLDKGEAEDDVVKANPLAKYHDDWNWGFISTERMTRQLYKDLSHKHSGQDHNHSH